MELKIHPELEAALDNLSSSEYDELKKAIQEDGVRDAIVVWDGFIVDGHNRYKIANELGKKFSIMRRDFADIDAVKQWIYRNQLARRNLTAERRAYYIGKLYLTEANTTKKFEKGNGAVGANIAKDLGVNEKTVRRNAEFAKGVDVIEKIKGPEAKKSLLNGKEPVNKKDVEELAKMPPAVVEKIKEEKSVRDGSIAGLLDKLKTIKEEKEEKTEAFEVVLVRPQFELDTAIQKPSFAKNAVCYMHCDDAFLPNGLRLLKSWGLEYQGTWVFKNDGREAGVYSHIEHSFLICATQGLPDGPEGKVMRGSMFGPFDNDRLKEMLEAYHPNQVKADLRKIGRYKTWKGGAA